MNPEPPKYARALTQQYRRVWCDVCDYDAESLTLRRRCQGVSEAVAGMETAQTIDGAKRCGHCYNRRQRAERNKA